MADENGEKIRENAEDCDSRVIYRGWKVMPLIIGNETFEKLGIDGAVSNMLIYLTTVFNMKKIDAVTIMNIFKGTTNLGTLVGAFLCDSYFGRYKTLGFSIIACFLGLLVIQLTSSIPELHPPYCEAESPNLCEKATPEQIAFLLTGFALLITGSGGIKPCNLAFGADQFNPKTELGKRGINSFFNWYFFTYTLAQMISLTLIVYVQSNVSWSIGLAIPVGLMFIASVMFFAGSKLYVKVKASGSPLTSILQVIVVAFKKRRLESPPPEQPWRSLYRFIPPKSINSEFPYTNQFRFLDKAAILTPKDETKPCGLPANPWRLCSLQQVEEVKCLLRVVPIWVSAIIFHLSIVQQHTYSIFQAVQMNRRLGNTDFTIPASTYVVFLMLSSTISIPIYDRILVPWLRRITGKQQGITLLQRMGIGIFISPITMIVSGVVEHQRRKIALTRPVLVLAGKKAGGVSSMSALWLVPQLGLAGLSEIFGAIGQMEFYYKQFPENMRSVGGSLFYCGLAGSSYLSSFLVSLVHRTTKGTPGGDWLPEDLNEGKLDYFYYMIAGLGFVNFGYFLMCSNWYKYKGGDADGHGEDQEEQYKTLA